MKWAAWWLTDKVFFKVSNSKVNSIMTECKDAVCSDQVNCPDENRIPQTMVHTWKNKYCQNDVAELLNIYKGGKEWVGLLPLLGLLHSPILVLSSHGVGRLNQFQNSTLGGWCRRILVSGQLPLKVDYLESRSRPLSVSVQQRKSGPITCCVLWLNIRNTSMNLTRRCITNSMT